MFIQIIKNKCIVLYGAEGKNSNWIDEFTKNSTVVVNDPMIIKDSIRLVSFQNKNDNVLKHFWTKIKNLLISRTHRETKIDSMMLELQKLISYKKKKEWVVVFKGSSIITIGGTSILTVFQEFGKWNDRLEKEKFESVFKDHHNKVEPNDHGMCRYMKVPYNTRKIPKIMYCFSSNCNCIMETSITYECCHNDG